MRRAEVAVVVLVVSLALGVYQNALDGEFAFDDRFAIVENSALAADAPWSLVWTRDFWGQPIDLADSHKSFRPLCSLTFRLNAWLFGPGVRSYHLVNNALHALVSALAYPVGRVLLWPERGARVCERSAALAVLFATHPIHTEAVSGLVGRAELLAAVFVLCALLVHARRPAGPRAGGADMWRAVVLAALVAAATLSKETGISVACVIVALELADAAAAMHPRGALWVSDDGTGSPNGGSAGAESAARLGTGSVGTGMGACAPTSPTPARARARSRVCIVAAMLVTVGVYILARRALAGDLTLALGRRLENPLIELTGARLVANICLLHWRYIALLLAPVRLCADYSYNALPLADSPWEPAAWAGWALYAGAFVWAASWARRWFVAPTGALRSQLVAVMLCVAPFVLSSNWLFFVGTFIGERLLYLPSLGFLAVLVGALYAAVAASAACLGVRSSAARTAVFALAVALIACCYTWRTVARNEDWRNEEALFVSAAEHCGGSAKTQMHRGILHRRRREFTAAMGCFERALAIEPSYCENWYWIGVTLFDQDKLRPAVNALQRALECRYAKVMAATALVQIYTALAHAYPSNPHYRGDLAKIYMAAGMAAPALDAFAQAIKLNPAMVDYYLLSAEVSRALGDEAGARASEAQYRTVRSALALLADPRGPKRAIDAQFADSSAEAKAEMLLSLERLRVYASATYPL